VLINNYYIQSNNGFIGCLVPLLILIGELLELFKLYATLQELLTQRIADNQFRPLLIPSGHYDLFIGIKDARSDTLNQVVVLHKQRPDAFRELNLHGRDALQDRLVSHRVHVAFDPFAY
jgi:hypothetical protein